MEPEKIKLAIEALQRKARDRGNELIALDPQSQRILGQLDILMGLEKEEEDVRGE